MADDVVDEAGEVGFRLRLSESFRYMLLFSRACRVLTIFGFVLVAASFVPALVDRQALLLGPGLVFAPAFIWLPLLAAVNPPERRYRVTKDSFEWSLQGHGGGRSSWASFRAARRYAGSLMLERRDRGPIAIPLRVFGPGQLTEFERLVQAGLTSGGSAGSVVPSDAGERVVSFRMQTPGFWKLVGIRTAESEFIVPVLVGAAGLVSAVFLASGGDMELAAPVGVVAIFAGSMPLTGALAVTFIGRRLIRPYDVAVYPAGYRSVGTTESWTPWKAFASATETPDGLCLLTGRSKHHVHLWTKGLTRSELSLLRSVLRDVELLPRA